MQIGDYALCVYDNRYRYVSSVLAKYNNEDFARQVWGEDLDGKTWQYMYFLAKPSEVNIPVIKLRTQLQDGYRGFTKISDESINSIMNTYGSVESFINEELRMEGQDSEAEFLNVVRRYHHEGTVFSSATKKRRYFIQSVDDSGCITKRIDANESERCTVSDYQNKRRLLATKGGSYRFNDFDDTAAKRATYLQALPFGLSADHENILDLSDENKALNVFCEIVRNLNVDISGGSPKLYKPAMVACVLDGMDSNQLTENKINFDWVVLKFIHKMTQLGSEVGEQQAATAFYHLTGDLFWMLSYQDPNYPLGPETPSPSQIREKVKYANIKDTFWRILQNASSRQAVLEAIRDKWWAPIKGNFWWVNQGHTYQQERIGNFVWAPAQNDQGQEFFHWTNVSKIQTGDLIFHYANGAIRSVSIAKSRGYESRRPNELPSKMWQSEGWRADLSYIDLTEPIELGQVSKELSSLQIDKSPLNSVGGVNQGYLYKLTEDAAKVIANQLDITDFPKDVASILSSLRGEIRVLLPEQRSKMMGELIKAIDLTGFIFQPWQIASYVTALRTKSFVILAGVTGTGKSKLPQLVAEATGAEAVLIPVRPDWTDSSDVLGYQDLQSHFRPGPLLEIAAEAMRNPRKNHIAIIDEMNLARVEHYFAEVLSQIENRKPSAKGGFQSACLLIHQLAGNDVRWNEVCLPPNLAIVGTVNMDESAHGFSRKVLDRAFTIELSDIDLDRWGTKGQGAEYHQPWPVTAWWPEGIRLGLVDATDKGKKDMINSTISRLNELNRLLIHAQLQIGYRTRDEIVLFILHASEVQDHFITKTGQAVDPFDLAVVMKVLPRIIGGSGAIRRLLLELLGWTYEGSLLKEEEEASAVMSSWESQDRGGEIGEATYPRSCARLCLMWDRLQNEGFTSFWL
jgi:hypothetical protein